MWTPESLATGRGDGDMQELNINGVVYVPKTRVAQIARNMMLKVIGDMHGLLIQQTGQELEEAASKADFAESPVPEQPRLEIGVAFDGALPINQAFMADIVAQVRKESVPTAALLSQKAKINCIYGDTVRIEMPRPFIEMFQRQPAKIDLLDRAVKQVMGKNLGVELWSAKKLTLAEPQGDDRVTSHQYKVYLAWRHFEDGVRAGNIDSYSYAEIQHRAGVSKAGCHGALHRLAELGYVTLDNIKGRRKK